MKFTVHFDSYSEIGTPMFYVRDADGIDPIGELIFADDDFFTRNKGDFAYASYPAIDYDDVALSMLTVPTTKDARLVVEEVFQYNDNDELLDVEFFKECASLVISELSL